MTMNKSSGYMESSSNGNLPAHIMHEILLRLPVKTLLKFKCVCKQWCALIESSSFANQHFVHESNQGRLLVRDEMPDSEEELEACSYALYIDDTYWAYEEPNPLQIPNKIGALLGPLNGVFCVVLESRLMALLNPAMRQIKLLPWPNSPNSRSYNSVGFGLDLLRGDFKVVLIQFFWERMYVDDWEGMYLEEETDVQFRPLVSVYSSGSDSWKHLEDVDLIKSIYFGYRSLCNTYLNGVYYWLVRPKDSVFAILAFDMSNEKFGKIQVPDCIKHEERNLKLALHGDLLALLSYGDATKIDKCVDIWVMEREGCWSKCFTVGPFQDVKWPLCFWNKNELLLAGGGTSRLALYNVSTQKVTTVATRSRFFEKWVYSYKESLFSLKGEADNGNLLDLSSDFVMDIFNLQ